jgi:RHS repeat-associated protein
MFQRRAEVKYQSVKLHPFGSCISNRGFSSAAYRYGFNGKEKETDGTADNYDFGARIYDGRLGRWLSVDPFFTSDPANSPFKSFNNCPVLFIDPDGKKEFEVAIVIDEKTGRSVETRIVKSNDIMTDGIKRTFTDVGGSEYEGYGYYDYEVVTTRTIKEDGSEVVTTATNILYDRGVIDDDGSFGGLVEPAKGTTKTDWDAVVLGEKSDQRKKEQPGGYYITTKESLNGVAKTQYYTPKNDAESQDLDALMNLVKTGSLQEISKWGEKLENGATGISDAVDVIDKIIEDVKKRNPEPCTVPQCDNKLCPRNSEDKLKNNPNIGHNVPQGTPLEKSWHGTGKGSKAVEVDCDKIKKPKE